MSFSKEDVGALGEHLQHINTHLVSISDDMRTVRNILVAFALISAIGSFGALFILSF